MIYQFTGQPGHGKTLHAIDKALDWVDEGREVYVCNIRAFQAPKAGMVEITPDQFKTWQEWAPDGSCFLIDEAYEQGMLPKRAPGSKVPPHVEQLAKHRHRGLDFIFVAQSPAKQMDQFVHDLIEQHVHVRRRYGTQFVHLRIFDRYEPNPAKAHPMVLKRTTLPKRPRGLYESTKLDTTERKVPWYYPALALIVLIVLAGSVFSFIKIRQIFDKDRVAATATPTANGAAATVGAVVPGQAAPPVDGRGSADDMLKSMTPRFPAAPWSAPLYDDRPVTAEPELFCVIGHEGYDAQGDYRSESCHCVTEQGTPYQLDDRFCRRIAVEGPPYNPFRVKRDQRQQQGPQSSSTSSPDGSVTGVGTSGHPGSQARYGYMRDAGPGSDPGPYAGD